MAEITIKTVLELGPDGKKKLRDEITVTLKTAEPAAREAGRKIGSALTAGIETGRNRSALERSEAAHIRRLEALHLRSASQLEVIERRKAAQIELIRERALHQEQARMKRLEFQARQSAASVARSFAAIGVLGIAGAAFGAGRSAFDAARDIDRTRSSIAAMTGSLEAANEKLAELRRLSQESIGVTNQLATSTFAAFKALGGVTDKTINDLIRGLGRLNAAFGLDDPNGFARNLQQIFTQGFERSDVKEALTRVPIFEQLLEQAFGTKDPDKLRKLKAAGTLTMDTFAAGIATAIEQNAILKSIPESIGARFDKVKDRILTAIAPVGDLIGDTLIVAANRLAISLENLAPTSENSFSRFRFALQETVRETDRLIGRVQDLFAQLTSGFRSVMEENTITAAQMAAVGAGFFNDLLRGENPLAPGSRANTIGRLNRLTDRGVTDPRNIPGAPSRDALIAARSGITLQELIERRRTASRSTSRTGGGGTGSRRDRFVPDFGLGEAEKLRHEVELARIRRDRLALVAQRQALPEGIGLPTLPLTAPGQPEIAGFPQEGLRQLEKAANELERLPHLLSDSERFMRGFNSQIETAGDAFDRFGANVSRALLNVRDLFASLKRAVLDFFNDLIGSTLQNLVKNTLSGLFGGGGGRGGGFGSLFGNLFRTPSFAGGDGISVPPSISGATGIFANGAFARGLSGGGGGSAATAGAANSGFSFGGLFGGLAGAAPLLGLGLGAGFGGQSGLGQALGAIGGGAIGLGLSFGASVFGAGGGLAAASLAALGPIALIGAPLLIGAVLLGKAAQRRRDEEASGQFLTQALQGIEQLAAAVGSGQITTLAEARGIFDSQILGTFKQQISGLKTKSVRDSRLTNQVRDLENVFQARIPPLIAEQEQRRLTAEQNALTHSRLIPEFATGGTARGGLAFLHPGEKIVNLTQQATMRAMSRPDIFERAGVPGPSANRNFDIGGTMPAGSSQEPLIVEVDVALLMGTSTADAIFVRGGSSDRGRQVIVRGVKVAQRDREL